jgi:hypothetical protein
MFERRLPINSFSATTMFVGSTAGGVAVVATNLTHANLKLEPLTDALRVSPIGSLTGSSMLVASQQIFEAPDGYTGALYCAPNAGATGAVALWESSF